MRLPSAVYSGSRSSVFSRAAMQTRTGPQAFFIMSTYCSGRSRPSLSTASDMTFHVTSTSRTCSTSSTQREVIQAQGHSGSNQKSTFVVMRPTYPRQLRLQHLSAWKDAQMSENNLHRDEAATRSALLTVQSYDVELDLTDGAGEKPGDTTFRSRSVIRFTCSEAGASSYLDLTAPTLLSATLNGTPVTDFDG